MCPYDYPPSQDSHNSKESKIIRANSNSKGNSPARPAARGTIIQYEELRSVWGEEVNYAVLPKEQTIYHKRKEAYINKGLKVILKGKT